MRPSVLVNALSVTRGGARSYAVNLIREFDRDDRGFDVTFLVPPGELESIETHRVEIRTVRLPTALRGLRVPARVAYELLVLPLVARSYDLLYCFADMAPPVCLTPTVMALRNLNIYDWRFYPSLRIYLLFVLARLGVPRARRVVFPTQAAASAIAPSLGVHDPRKIAIVPHGIDPSAFSPAQPVSSDTPFVFLPAAVEKHKNLEVLVECLPHVSDPRLEIWVAGPMDFDPGYAQALRQRARELGCAERFKLLGPQPYETIMRYYRGAVAFVFPSHIETFGHPILEAMLAETPMLASDIPSFHETAGDAASYFPLDDPIALARGIDDIVANPEAAKHRARLGIERVQTYTWRHSVDLLTEAFGAALRERHRG